MTQDEYTKRLNNICEELLTIDWGDDRNTYYSYLAEAITEIQQLNNEAIGEDNGCGFCGDIVQTKLRNIMGSSDRSK